MPTNGLSTAHRPAAKLALIAVLDRDYPEFFDGVVELASPIARVRHSAPEISSLLDRFRVNTPWMMLLAANTANSAWSERLDIDEPVDPATIARRLILRLPRQPGPPSVRPRESKSSYLRRAGQYFDALSTSRRRLEPSRAVDFERHASWFLSIARREKSGTAIAKAAGLQPQSVFQSVNRFATILYLRPMLPAGSGRRPGRKEAGPRRRVSSRHSEGS